MMKILAQTFPNKLQIKKLTLILFLALTGTQANAADHFLGLNIVDGTEILDGEVGRLSNATSTLVNGTMTIQGGGELWVESARRLTLGSIVGTGSFSGAIINNGTTRVDGQLWTFQGSKIENNGIWHIGASGKTVITGTFNNNGVVYNRGHLENNYNASQYMGTINNLASGTIINYSGSVLADHGYVNNYGKIFFEDSNTLGSKGYAANTIFLNEGTVGFLPTSTTAQTLTIQSTPGSKIMLGGNGRFQLNLYDENQDGILEADQIVVKENGHIYDTMKLKFVTSIPDLMNKIVDLNGGTVVVTFEDFVTSTADSGLSKEAAVALADDGKVGAYQLSMGQRTEGSNEVWYLQSAHFNPDYGSAYTRLPQIAFLSTDPAFQYLSDWIDPQKGIRTFARVSAIDTNLDAGNGYDLKGYSLVAGLGDRHLLENAALDWGVFMNYGQGMHDGSFNAGSLRIQGDGDVSHYGLGASLRYVDTVKQFYVKGSVVAGKSKMDYTGTGEAYFESEAPYYGAQLGIGKSWVHEQHNITASFDGRWVNLDSDDTESRLKENLHWGQEQSLSLKAGVRYGYDDAKNAVIPFVGLAYNQEFDSKSYAWVDGNKANALDIKGGTGILELGLKTRSGERWQIDARIQGYAGEYEGLGARAEVQYFF